MDFIRKTANAAAHSAGRKITAEQAALCLENLFVFLDFVACCYGREYQPQEFDRSLLGQEQAAPVKEAGESVDLSALLVENAALKEELTAHRAEQQESYVRKPLELSEYKTRKLYIDAMLADAGWTEGKDWINEVELPGMPNKSEGGYADYVLYSDDGKPLAVVEAKRTCVDVSKGRQQAKLYADLLEQYHRRPVIFLTNGFEPRIQDNLYPERRCAAIWSKRDLEKLFNLQTMRTSLKYVTVDETIAGRWYQKGAVTAVCEAFGEQIRRKALLVMATDSGKTRTVIALVKVLLDRGWVKNVLFLADRDSLVTQAKRAFVNLLPDLSVTNLCEEKDNYTAHCVFSTYQTMMNVIDVAADEQGKLFTCGHFDLVICDEAHRCIYNKYQDIFTYFDAPLVGLTATPKDEIGKNTYEIFELESGVPTYGYELAQAVKDGYLVDFMSVETTLKFIQQGIVYDELSDEDKAAYEDTFTDENFEGLINYIMDKLPTIESIEGAIRKNTCTFPMLSIRELVANALIHQDLNENGSPVVSIFPDHIEITNPGKPLISFDRFIDHPPCSRNESLAAAMHKVGVCEERGSGYDKIISYVERYNLPAPIITEYERSTKVSLYSKKDFDALTKKEKIAACYAHVCLNYVKNEPSNNSTLRNRFKLSENERYKVSRVFNDTCNAKLIKVRSGTGMKNREYIPYWAKESEI